MTKLATAVAAVLVPGAAIAHPGHASSGDFGIAHYLTDPIHVGILGAAALLIVAIRRSILQRRLQRATVR